MAVDAVSYGWGDGRRQAMAQSAPVATLRTAAAAWPGVRRCRAAGQRVPARARLPPVAVAVKGYSAEAWLRVPGLRPDELVVHRASAMAGDAAGDLPGPPDEAWFRAGAGTPGRLHFTEGNNCWACRVL